MPETRAATIPKLLDQGGPGYAALMRLAAQEKDAMAKTLIWQTLAADMPRLAAALLADGQDARLQEILEQGLAGEGDAAARQLRRLAAGARQAGREDARMAEEGGAAPDKKTALTLAYLCRAKGDLGGARRYAEKADHAGLLQTILIEQEDWRALLKRIDAAPPPAAGFLAPPAASRDAVACAWRACAWRATARASRPCCASCRTSCPGASISSAFLLNGRPDEALGWLTKQNEHATAAELLSARLRYRDALDAADRPVPAEKGGDPTAARLFKAGLLARMGERKKAPRDFR